jgi:RsiW-degrading membrane proteinase PrsW (M82 family)
MQMPFILIIISFVLGLFVLEYIRSFDLHEKEPLKKMVLVMVWGGFVSIGICSILYGWVHSFGIKELKNAFGAMFIIGPVEEAAKFIALASSYIFIRKDLNEPTDGLIYMSCVAVGFSLIENYFYATHTPNSGYLLFLRLLICTPGHILFSAFMGIAFYHLFRLKTGVILFVISYLYACLAHGIWDTIAFYGWTIIFLYFIVKVTYGWTLNILSYTTAKSPFRKTLKEFVETCERPVESKGIECLNCGSQNDKITYTMKKIEFQKCDSCSFFIAAKESLFEIFKFFGSIFKKDFSAFYWDGKFFKTEYSTLLKGSSVSDSKSLAYFDLNVFNNALIELNEKIVENFENHWWYPKKMAKKRNKRVSLSKISGVGGTERSGRQFDFAKITLIPLIITSTIVLITIFFLWNPEITLGYFILGFPFLIIFFGILYGIGLDMKKK